jgi:hypothetical protein
VSLVKLWGLERHGIDKSSAAGAAPRLPFSESEDAAAKTAPAQCFMKIEQVEKEQPKRGMPEEATHRLATLVVVHDNIKYRPIGCPEYFDVVLGKPRAQRDFRTRIAYRCDHWKGIAGHGVALRAGLIGVDPIPSPSAFFQADFGRRNLAIVDTIIRENVDIKLPLVLPSSQYSVYHEARGIKGNRVRASNCGEPS